MLDQIVIIVLLFCLVSLVGYAMLLTKKINSLNTDLAQTMLDKSELLNELAKEMDKAANKIHNDSFIRFLSDSRDAAFDYIETTQLTIMEFMSVADKMSFARSIDKELIKQYKESYSKLIDLLPIVNDAVEK